MQINKKKMRLENATYILPYYRYKNPNFRGLTPEAKMPYFAA